MAQKLLIRLERASCFLSSPVQKVMAGWSWMPCISLFGQSRFGSRDRSFFVDKNEFYIVFYHHHDHSSPPSNEQNADLTQKLKFSEWRA